MELKAGASQEKEFYSNINLAEFEGGTNSFCDWDPNKQKWRDFEFVVDALFADYKKLYKTRVNPENKVPQGLKEKRNTEHFDWFVRYQILKESCSDIADHYAKSCGKALANDAVIKGVNNVAKSLEITLRDRYCWRSVKMAARFSPPMTEELSRHHANVGRIPTTTQNSAHANLCE